MPDQIKNSPAEKNGLLVHTVDLTLSDVLNMTETGTLEVTGDISDTLNVDTSGWTPGTVTDNGDNTHSYEYSSGGDSITLTVDDQIDTTGM